MRRTYRWQMLVSVGQVESNLTAGARSGADARGLLQVLPSGGAPTQQTLDYFANVTALWPDLRGCR